MILQAVAAGDATLLATSCGAAGSTHDSRAFKQTELGCQLYESGMKEPFFIVGDDAYACTNSVLTPFPGKYFLLACLRCLWKQMAHAMLRVLT